MASDAANVYFVASRFVTMTFNNASNGDGEARLNDAFMLKAGLAQMLKGGVIMDVTTAEEARIAEEAGACAVMALERVPAE